MREAERAEAPSPTPEHLVSGTAPEPPAPGTAKPYKAERYAAAAQVSELPRPLNRDSLSLRKYYPTQAKKNGFEGDVVPFTIHFTLD